MRLGVCSRRFSFGNFFLEGVGCEDKFILIDFFADNEIKKDMRTLKNG